jgi:hypothetical protein
MCPLVGFRSNVPFLLGLFSGYDFHLVVHIKLKFVDLRSASPRIPAAAAYPANQETFHCTASSEGASTASPVAPRFICWAMFEVCHLKKLKMSWTL